MAKRRVARQGLSSLLGVVLMASLMHALPVSATPGCTGTAGDAAALASEVNSSNASPSDDTITLVAGCTYKITDTLLVNNGTHKLTITGNGATIDGSDMHRIFHVNNGATLVLDNVTLTHGSAALAPHRGGAVWNQIGTVRVLSSRIVGNEGYGGGAAIYNQEPDNLVVVKDSVLSANSSKGTGGAVYNNGIIEFSNSTLSNNDCRESDHGGGALFINLHASATFTNSTLFNNRCTGTTVTPGFPGEPGGGAISSYGALELTDSTLSNNSADYNGGAILSTLGTVALVNSTLSGNTAGRDGGGIYTGHLHNPPGRINRTTLSNSTLSGNTAGNDGGGIYSVTESVLANSTVSGNSAGRDGGGIFLSPYSTVVADNSIVAGSSGGGNCAGSFSPTGSKNLSDTAACGSSFLVGNPNLGPLASNGGLTMTHALLAGSGAINAGANNTCLATDQRGVARARTTVDACDIGAFESPAGAPVGTITYYSGRGISRPWGITAGPDGALWFTNMGNNTIGRITTGGVIDNYPAGSSGTGNATPPTPRGITTGSDGRIWFTDPADNTVGRIDAYTHMVKRFHGGGISAPFTISAGADGSLWFPNGGPVNGGPGPSSIGRIDPVTEKIFKYPDALVRSPWGIEAGSDGALWFTNHGTVSQRSIGRIDPNQPLPMTQYWSPQMSSPPSAITSGPDGALWFSTGDNSDHSIMRIDPFTKKFTKYTNVDTRSTYGMTTGPDGAIWFTYWKSPQGIRRFDPVTQQVTKYPTPSSFPVEIASGPDGAIWFTDLHGRIGRIQAGPPPPTFSTASPVPVGVTCPQSSCPNGATPLKMKTGHLDQDGVPDFVTANSLHGVSVRLGNGDGTFRDPPGGATAADLAVPGGAWAVDVADFDKDGKEDLAVTGRPTSQPNMLTVLLGNGDGTFQPGLTSTLTAGSPYKDIAVARLNADAYPDLAIANREDFTVTILLNDANPSSPGSFHPATKPTVVLNARIDSIALADLDHDGPVDLVATQFYGGLANGIKVARGNGDGTFGAPAAFAAGQHPDSVVVADVNQDNRRDLVVANWTEFCNTVPNPTCEESERGSVSVLLGKPSAAGTVAYKPSVQYPAGFSPSWVGVADLDQDGRLDIANTNYGNNSLGGSVTIQRGLVGGLFNSAPSVALGYGPEPSAIVDLNCDKYPDLLVPRNGSDQPDKVTVLLNTSPGSSAAGCPVPPLPTVCAGTAKVGTPGNDGLMGTPGADVICGLGGKDTLFGAGGNDVLLGGGQDDTLYGQGGNDRLFGEGGNDALYGQADDDGLNGGAGADNCDGGIGINQFLLC